jgi:predicted esterase
MRRCVLTAAVGALLSAAAWAQQTSESGLQYTLVGSGSPGGRIPMIIFLHGTGGGTGVWGAYVNAARAKGYLCVIPVSTGDGKGDPKSGNQNDDKQRRWAEVDVPKLAGLAREMQRKHAADPRRTFIAGYSNGGFYASETGLRNPDVFSAVLIMGGGCNVYNFTEAAKNVGVYIVHGTADSSVAFDVGKKAAERLKAAGFKDVVFKEKAGGGHIVFSDEIQPYLEWLGRQKRRTTPGANASLKWGTDFKAAVESGRRVLLYPYSPKDSDSDVADWFETELLSDPLFIAASESFFCVKVNRDEVELPAELKAKRPCLTVFEIDKGKTKVLARFEAISAPRAAAEKLKGLKKK